MEKILMGAIALFTALTLISYFLIVLNVPFLFIPIVIGLIAFGIKPLIKRVKKIKITLNLPTIITILVFVIGIAGQLAIISPSGIFQGKDVVFWSAHGHDGAWHIALMEEMKKGWPFQNPIFAGEKLTNYHFFSDILPTMVSKYLPVSNLNLYFRVFPFFYSIFLGAAAYFLTKKLTKSVPSAIWATIFTYFAGSFGFILTYIKNKTIGGESIFWATQPQSSSGNPPQIISNFMILAATYFILNFESEKNKTKKRNLFIISAIIIGTLTSFKVYAGVVLFMGLGIVSLVRLVKEKKLDLLLLTLVSGALTALVYLPNTSNSASFLILEPWWYIRTMIVEESRLNLLDWELRRQTYIYEHNIKRVIFLEGLGLAIFFFGNLGMRIIALWEFLKTKLLITSIIVFSFILPLLFLQKGVASNTSQFLQYFVLFFGIIAGIATSKITKKFKFLIPVIIILMIPTQLGLLREFYSRPAFAKISGQELEALAFIKNSSNPQNTIVTPPYNKYLNLGEITPNIWDWFDTAYVSAFSSRRTYFDDYEQADIMGYKGEERIKNKLIIFENVNPEVVKNTFDQTNAQYLYFPKILKPAVDPSAIGLTLVFSNQEIEVWRAN